jgi:hypothetical protein
MTHLVRCHDTYEPLSGFKLPRGQAGVSISRPSDWSSKVKQLPDGNERIIAITIATKVNICIINAYLPTHGTHSSEEYRECLDVIHNIIQKYLESHVIFLCGDLIGTLLQSRMNKYDSLLKELIRELDLTTNIGIGSQSTFFHHAHNSESQIDYILTTNKDMIKDYTIIEKGTTNISAHVPVTVTTAIQPPTIPKNIRQHKLVKQKIDQIDNEKYNENITANFKDIVDFQNSELKIQKISEAILLAQKEAIPTKSINMKSPRCKASPQVLEQLRKCKSIYT